jgi:serine/threonine-protein kinase
LSGSSFLAEENMLSHYKVQRLINQGGMGEIYLAQDTRLHRTVAIKTLKAHVHHEVDKSNKNNANLVESALNEARLLAKLNHPNIVQIYDIIEGNEDKDNSHVSLVMEYLAGKSLQRYQQEHILTLTQKLSILTQISGAIAAAHSQGVIHCDLKPSNIIIDAAGHVKIVDFGIAQLTQQFSQSTMTVGDDITPVHQHTFGCQTAMSPEQLTYSPESSLINTIDFRTDLFSLGILAFTLITGKHPFIDNSINSITYNIINNRVADAQNIVPSLPNELIYLLNRLLAHNKEERPNDSVWVYEYFEKITIALTQQAILAQETQPLNIKTLSSEDTLSNNEPTSVMYLVNKRWRLTVLIIFTILLVTIATIVTFYDEVFASNEMKTRHVVILPPTHNANTADDQIPIANMQKKLVTAAIDDALRQRIIHSKPLRLISHAEVVDIGQGSLTNFSLIGAATGADDIITTVLDCNNVRCDVTLSRLTANKRGSDEVKEVPKTWTDKWRIASQQKWPTLLENVSDIYQESQSRIDQLYSDFQLRSARPITANPDDYLQYAKLYTSMLIDGESNDVNLQNLANVINRSPYLFSAYTLYREAALTLFNASNDSEYIEQLERLMNDGPPEYKYSIFQAIDAFAIAIAKGDIELAQNQMKIVISRGADKSTIVELQAALYLTRHDLNNAITFYKSALILRPSTKLLYNLALSYYFNGDFGNAQTRLTELLLITPEHYDANQLLAGIHLFQGHIEQAITYYEKIVEINNQITDLNNLGVAYSLVGRYQDAYNIIKKAFIMSPSQPLSLLNLADIEMLLGLKKDAVKHYLQLIDLHYESNTIEAWLDKAQAYAHINQNTAAIKALNQAKKLSPTNNDISFIAALVYSILGEYTSSITQVEEALMTDMGIVWFNLPWFDNLCLNKEFQQLMAKESNSKRCQL